MRADNVPERSRGSDRRHPSRGARSQTKGGPLISVGPCSSIASTSRNLRIPPGEADHGSARSTPSPVQSNEPRPTRKNPEGTLFRYLASPIVGTNVGGGGQLRDRRQSIRGWIVAPVRIPAPATDLPGETRIRSCSPAECRQLHEVLPPPPPPPPRYPQQGQPTVAGWLHAWRRLVHLVLLPAAVTPVEAFGL